MTDRSKRKEFMKEIARKTTTALSISKSTNETKSISVGEFTGILTVVVTLLGIELYLTGWTYAYAYFRSFHVPSMMVELSREEVFLYGALAFWKRLWFSASFFGIAILVAAFGSRLLRPFTWLKIIVIGIVASAAFFALARVTGLAAAAADAEYQRRNDYPAYPRVEITWVDAIRAESTSRVGDIVRSGCARLLLVSDERVFLIRPVLNAPGIALSTFILHWSDISSLRINDNYTSCE